MLSGYRNDVVRLLGRLIGRQRGFHLGKNRLAVKRLLEHRACAEIPNQATKCGGLGRDFAGDHDRLLVRASRTQLQNRLDSAELGHHDIENDEIETNVLDEAKAVLAARGQVDGVPRFFEKTLEHCAHGVIVVYDQYLLFDHRRHHGEKYIPVLGCKSNVRRELGEYAIDFRLSVRNSQSFPE